MQSVKLENFQIESETNFEATGREVMATKSSMKKLDYKSTYWQLLSPANYAW